MKSHESKPAFRPIFSWSPKRGFALIVTLSLMILLTVIAVGLLTLSTISLRASSNASAMAAAQANARLAMMLAIGELQKHAGADQRVTGRADILDAASPNPAWTAVWNSKGGLPAYLVSGNEGLNMDLNTTPPPATQPASYFKPVTQLTDDKTSVALLASNLPATQLPVRVPLVKVVDKAGKATGSYGYWVSDEGVKARFNMKNPYAPNGATPDKNRAGLVSQSNSGKYASTELITNWPASNANVDRALTVNQGQLLVPASPKFNQTYFQSFTAYSQGLLTDAKNGGLKRDLTLAFETPSVFTRWFGRSSVSESLSGVNTVGGYDRNGKPERFLISNVFMTNSGSNKQVGPNWGTMCHYYNLYKLNPDATDLGILHPQPPESMEIRRSHWNPYTEYANPGDTQKADFQHTNNYLSPVPARVQASYRLGAKKYVSTDANNGKYTLELKFKPLIGIWNPYNVRFKKNAYHFDWELSPVLDITITDGGAPRDMVITLTDWYRESGESEWIRMALDGTDSADLQPGELRMFSLTTETKLNRGAYQGGGGSGNGKLKATWGANGYYTMTIPDQPATPTKGTKYGDLYVSAGATIKVKKVSLSEQEYKNSSGTIVADSAGNFLTMKPGVGTVDNSLVSTFRTTNFWQPKQSAMSPEEITGIPSKTASELAASAEVLGTWAFALRPTTGSSTQKVRNLIDSNVRAANSNSRWDGSLGGQGMTTISAYRGEGPLGRGLLGAGESAEPQTDDNLRYRMKAGDGNQTHIVAFDVPRVAPLSLGAFQHAVLGRYCNEPSFVLGNSYASIRVPLDKKLNTSFTPAGGIPFVTYDTSYLVNENVWDPYF
ncbi:MAG: hypothetical protein H8M99_09375, partial [Gloeobacteraceae cyanobacterium ES-bin-144]|nr:hypothetical protein [Verrucomicrobiales bacterium]